MNSFFIMFSSSFVFLFRFREGLKRWYYYLTIWFSSWTIVETCQRLNSVLCLIYRFYWSNSIKNLFATLPSSIINCEGDNGLFLTEKITFWFVEGQHFPVIDHFQQEKDFMDVLDFDQLHFLDHFEILVILILMIFSSFIHCLSWKFLINWGGIFLWMF